MLRQVRLQFVLEELVFAADQPEIPGVASDLKHPPVLLDVQHDIVQTRRHVTSFFGIERVYTAERHGDEGAGVGAGVERRLDATQQVVCLEQQQHLTRHAVQDVRYLR